MQRTDRQEEKQGYYRRRRHHAPACGHASGDTYNDDWGVDAVARRRGCSGV